MGHKFKIRDMKMYKAAGEVSESGKCMTDINIFSGYVK